ncbi:MAG: hypothetical protein KA118_13830 [Verrucomicrobia bacterium]|nr:hypothetical protein [Verrucomicrobiota bacterium]
MTAVRPHRGEMLLVFAMLGLVMCFPFGVAAWVMARGDLRKMRRGWMDPGGEGMTRAARKCGIAGTLLFLLLAVAGCVLAWAIREQRLTIPGE